MKPATLRDLLDQPILVALAGERAYERGAAYFAKGNVGPITEENDTISAVVIGSEAYRVRLSPEWGVLAYECTCPVGDTAMFCKHCVAVALAYLGGTTPALPKQRKKAVKATVTLDDVRAHLVSREPAELADMLIQHAAEDDRLRQRLILLAAKKNSKSLDTSAYRRAIDKAVNIRDMVNYRDAPHYARGVHDVINSLDELFKNGYAAEVIDLAEHALARVEVATQRIDDSDGYMSEFMGRLQTLHLEACKTARPDPEALAKRLCEWELNGKWDVFGGAAETYASILGDTGIAVYRRIAEKKWASLPPLHPGRDSNGAFVARFNITRVMEALARQSGDVEALVEVKKRDLSLPYSFLEIAEIYSGAGKHDLALEWAERGVVAFPTPADRRLTEFIVNEYHRRKRHDDAMALIWTAFTARPSVEEYRSLNDHATRSKAWKAWRAKALAVLRGAHRPDRSELVRVFLWEKDVDAAWKEAQEGGCSDGLWEALAHAREADHPEDALPIYQRQVDLTLSHAKEQAYREAVKRLREIRSLMAQLGQHAEFKIYVASVRTRHKAKRNFMKLLDQAKLA